MSSHKLIETRLPVEKAILIGVKLADVPEEELQYSLEELEELANTAGIETLDTFVQSRHTIEPATFIGKGKVEEITRLAETLAADLIIFDTELSPAQIKNLEKITKKPVLDRTDVILQIFAYRAQTREAKSQVELAQLKYTLPRLKRLWSHLERQVGGVGVRGGPGEKQIEVDRRIIRKRIDKLERELKQIDKRRRLRSNSRRDCFTVALIGYTNVGKSTLFNRLSNAHVFVEDRLFATLDSTVKSVTLDKNTECLLIDTVGFIRKLPHHLVASFRSTLEEACSADLLLHIVDISSPFLVEQIDAVEQTLTQLETQDTPIIFVLNKSDKVEADSCRIWETLPDETPYVIISAKTGENIDMLQEIMLETMAQYLIEEEFVFPIQETRCIAELHSIGTILSKKYQDEYVKILCRAPIHELKRFKKNNFHVED